MSDFAPIVNSSVRINIARGLSGLIDQAAAKLKTQVPAHVPSLGQLIDGCGDVLKHVVQTHPNIPQEEITAVEAAEKLGILKKRRRR